MRFLVFMIPGKQSTELAERVMDSKKGPPTATDSKQLAEQMTKMGQFNDELEKAGVLLSVDGLLTLKQSGARLGFSGGKASVTDGPFIETKEVVGGFWLLQAKSKQEVVDWFKRCPAQLDDVIEVRQIAEMSDFPADFGNAAGGT